jgi:hypothetical protein
MVDGALSEEESESRRLSVLPNLPLLTGPQLLIGKALALQFEQQDLMTQIRL